MTRYYVDASRPNNSGDGTSWPTAKKDFQAGVNLLGHGDTLEVADGVYNEKVTISANGSLSQPVVIEAANGATPIIDGSGITLKEYDPLVNISGNYVICAGITVRDVGSGSVNKSPAIKLNACTGSMLYRNKTSNTKGPGILVNSCGFFDVIENEIEDAAMFNEGSVSGNGWPAALNITKSGRNPSRISHVKGNIVKRSWGEAIGVTKNSQYVDVHENISMLAKIGIYFDCAQKCRAYRNLVVWPDDWDDTEYWAGSSSSKRAGQGIGIRSEGPQVNKGNDPNEDIIVENNLVVGWRQNIFVANTSSKPNGPGLVVRNNTCIGRAETGTGIDISKAQLGLEVYNNLLVSDHGTHISNSGTGPITIRNNLRHGNASAGVTGSGDASGNPLLVYPNLTINEADLVLANLDSIAESFKIGSASSPAINRGWSGKSVQLDYFNAARSDGTPDMGFHEWNGTTGNVTERISWSVVSENLVGEAPLTVSVDASGTVSTTGNALTFSINWGEPGVGNTSGSAGSHTYSTGDYEIAILAVSSSGLASTYRLAVRAYEEGSGGGGDETPSATAEDLGSNGYDGTHYNNEPADGGMGRAYDGSTSYTDIDAVKTGMSGTVGLFMAAARTSVWEDSTERHLLHLKGNGSNHFALYKETDNNAFKFEWKSGGTLKTYQHAGLSSSDWMTFASRIDGNYLNHFVDGEYQVQRWVPDGDAWDASSLTDALVGVNPDSDKWWLGDIAHVSVAWDVSPTNEQIASIHNHMLNNTLSTTVLDAILGAGNYSYYPLRDTTGGVTPPDNTDLLEMALLDVGAHELPGTAYEALPLAGDQGLIFGQTLFKSSSFARLMVVVEYDEDETPTVVPPSNWLDTAEGGMALELYVGNDIGLTAGDQVLFRLAGYDGGGSLEGYLQLRRELSASVDKLHADLKWGANEYTYEIGNTDQDEWNTVGFTWSLSGGEAAFYLNGTQVGTVSITGSAWDVDHVLLAAEETDDSAEAFTNMATATLRHAALFFSGEPPQSEFEDLTTDLHSAETADFNAAATDTAGWAHWLLYSEDSTDGLLVDIDIDVDPEVGEAPLDVTVDLSGSTFQNLNLDYYVVYFGDGDSETVYEDSVEHTYSTTGRFLIQVIAFTDIGTFHFAVHEVPLTVYGTDTVPPDETHDEITALTTQISDAATAETALTDCLSKVEALLEALTRPI